MLWIALKFFVLLQSKQPFTGIRAERSRCELPSNFLYFCSRNNWRSNRSLNGAVVNCSQIFCTFAVETTVHFLSHLSVSLWIALKFFVLLQSKQPYYESVMDVHVVNCSQIFCTFAVETTVNVLWLLLRLLWIALKFFVLLQSKQLRKRNERAERGCELLSNFLYFCSRNNK